MPSGVHGDYYPPDQSTFKFEDTSEWQFWMDVFVAGVSRMPPGLSQEDIVQTAMRLADAAVLTMRERLKD